MRSDKEINNEFRSVVLNQLDTGVFITEAETDRIVYMNETMKKRFHLTDPEGKFCYKVLQKDMEKRCAFCNRQQLLTNSQLSDCVWNEVNTINHRLYKNYDQLFEWDGKKYFIENSIDITDLMPIEKENKLNSNDTEFNENEDIFMQHVLRARDEKKSVTIVLCDINDMKFINNQYGRQEGDCLLSKFTNYFKQKLNENDLFIIWKVISSLPYCMVIIIRMRKIVFIRFSNHLLLKRIKDRCLMNLHSALDCLKYILQIIIM